jgi:O-Antigen ligase
LISPIALILALALAGGGFVVSQRHIAGLAVWLILVGMLALGVAGRATLGRPFYWVTGSIGALALFSAFSSLWSGSIELSVIEADRVLVYLGFFLASFLIAQTDQRRQRFAEGIGIALIGVAIIALATRLLPHLVELGPGLGSNARLGYPLGYWNADGIVFAIGAAFCLWLSRGSLIGALRWIAVAVMPAVFLALYFTYSRGGLLALAVACVCLIVLSRDRLWLLATLAIAGIGALPALLAAGAERAVADNVDSSAAVSQGLELLLILLAGTALALLLFAGLRRLEARQGARTVRAVEVSRDPKLLRRLGLVAVAATIVAAVAFGPRAWDQFTSGDLSFPSKPEQHLTQLDSGGRDEFWRVALDAFDEDPVAGHGAGTYRFSWIELRHINRQVLDAHSLYLESFAELGVVGGLLVLGLVGTILWTGFAAWRAAVGRQRELYGVLLAACLTFAIAAGIDWMWEIAAVGAIFFLAGGALVAGRCAQLVGRRAASNGQGQQRRYGLAVAGLAIAWISALALIGPLLVDREIDASRAAAEDGNLPSAVDRAESARSIEPWAASPYIQLSLLAEAQGEFPTALQRVNQAIDREEGNWNLYYLRARIEHQAGEDQAARASRAEAQRLNPEEQCLLDGFEGCG